MKKMKKICRNCRALIEGNHNYCEFGYKTERREKKFYDGKKCIGSIYYSVPLEICPKPLTWKEYYKYFK